MMVSLSNWSDQMFYSKINTVWCYSEYVFGTVKITGPVVHITLNLKMYGLK